MFFVFITGCECYRVEGKHLNLCIGSCKLGAAKQPCALELPMDTGLEKCVDCMCLVSLLPVWSSIWTGLIHTVPIKDHIRRSNIILRSLLPCHQLCVPEQSLKKVSFMYIGFVNSPSQYDWGVTVMELILCLSSHKVY